MTRWSADAAAARRPSITIAERGSQLGEMGEDFWQAFQALDRAKLFEDTLATLRESGRPLTLGELSRALPPTHDLETLAYWLGMAREAGIVLGDEVEHIDLDDEEEGGFRFAVPATHLDFQTSQTLDADKLG